MPLSLSDYLAYVRAKTLPGYAPPAASGEPFGTRSTVTSDGGSSAVGSMALSSPGDTSLGGRAALSADLNTPSVLGVSGSVAKAAFGLMGMLAGPLGTIGSKVALAAMDAHNENAIQGELGNRAGEFSQAIGKAEAKADALTTSLAKSGAVSDTEEDALALPSIIADTALPENNPQTIVDSARTAVLANAVAARDSALATLAPSAFSQTNVPGVTTGFGFGVTGHPAFGMQGFNAPSQSPSPYGQTPSIQGRGDTANGPPGTPGNPGVGPPGEDDGGMGGVPSGPAGPAGPGPAGPAGGPSGATGDGPYHQGGVVEDREPGLSERITAQQGEYVVRRARAAHYRPLLEAINKGKPADVKRALKAALTA